MIATVKFLDHYGDGRNGPEAEVPLGPGESQTYADVLGSLFGLESDYGPIRVTPSETGLVGAVPRSIVGVRQDALFPTNLMLANAGESPVDVDVALFSPVGGAPVASRRVPVGPLGFVQLNVENDLGVDGVEGAAFVLSTPSPAGALAAYASAIDRKTGDPRTLLPR